ncbi:endonuclease/exonuclease/phosphatase family protein [Gossypium australe]|uniref:Endonuclease/exonuclease/phosphatase family protein n=1 Tax=Gossypium australe TaxID=47621 RepID=A0A5B6VW37_9ROSI|nr:endonuclease/exonuclease/phosphatase family protein [Gossypium australe]
MKTFCRNVRNLGRPQAVRRLRHMLKVYSPQIVFLIETSTYAKAWRRNSTTTLRSFSKYHIYIEFKEGDEGNKWRFTSFYGASDLRHREDT